MSRGNKRRFINAAKNITTASTSDVQPGASIAHLKKTVQPQIANLRQMPASLVSDDETEVVDEVTTKRAQKLEVAQRTDDEKAARAEEDAQKLQVYVDAAAQNLSGDDDDEERKLRIIGDGNRVLSGRGDAEVLCIGGDEYVQDDQYAACERSASQTVSASSNSAT